MKTFYKLFVVLILSIYFIAPFSIFASEIIFQNPNKTLGVGDEFSMPILLSSQDENVNAISGDIVWSDETLSAMNVFSANSIVSSWVEMPHISGNSVVFSGIMPGGYQGGVIDPMTQKSSPGTIAVITFRVKKAGTAKIEFTDEHLYKNDSFGTEVPLQNNPLTLSFSEKGSGLSVFTYDTNPPEDFIPIISQDPNVYDGRFTVVFSTNDKETGIDHYEVKQGEDGEWVRAESPFPLVDQEFSGTVFVKAIDLVGNYKIGAVQMEQKAPISVMVIYLILIVLALIFLRWMFVRHLKKKKKFLGK